MRDVSTIAAQKWRSPSDEWVRNAERALKADDIGGFLKRVSSDDVAYEALPQSQDPVKSNFSPRVEGFACELFHGADEAGATAGGAASLGVDVNNRFDVSAFDIDRAGAGYATQIGALAAGVIAKSRVRETPDEVAFAVDHHVPTAISALRACRAVLMRVHEVLERDAPVRLTAVTSERMLSGVDADTNMIRNACAAFAAVAGGADVIVVRPHKPDDAEAARTALNTARLLLHECRMDAPTDPAHGAPFFEALTDALAAAAWAFMQEIEAAGGVESEAGRALVEKRAGEDRERRVAALRDGAEIVGVTAYPPPKPGAPAEEGLDALAKAAGRLAGVGAGADA